MKKILIFTIFLLFFFNEAVAETLEVTIVPGTSICADICAKNFDVNLETLKGSCKANADIVKFKSARVTNSPSNQLFTCASTSATNQSSCVTACGNAVTAENTAIGNATKTVTLVSPSSDNNCSTICSKDFDKSGTSFQGRCSANLDIVKFSADGVTYSAGDHSFECSTTPQSNVEKCEQACGNVKTTLKAAEDLASAREVVVLNNQQVDVMGNTTHNLSRNILTRVMCNAYRIVTGSAGATFAAFAVIATGIGFFSGKVSWGLMIGVAAGIASMFGAPSIVAAISGQTVQTNCSIQINEVPVP
jgi:type IV secretory pathway VirB2 component (pilin)